MFTADIIKFGTSVAYNLYEDRNSITTSVGIK